jgi:hypothetical protein
MPMTLSAPLRLPDAHLTAGRKSRSRSAPMLFQQ